MNISTPLGLSENICRIDTQARAFIADWRIVGITAGDDFLGLLTSTVPTDIGPSLTGWLWRQSVRA